MLNQTQFPKTFGQNNTNPYMNNEEINTFNPMNTSMPQPMQGDITEDNAYPFESQFNPAIPQPNSYAKGGRVKKKEKYNPFPSLAEMIRKQGNGEDSILAHINPIEVLILKSIGGSGSTNKITGLPQFGFFNKPGKALKSVLGGGGGAILGNMLLPGIGGVIGGALGQGLQHKSRGKSFAEGALKGGMMGGVLPSTAGLLGEGATSLGFTGTGKYLTDYGTTNAILPSIGMGKGASIASHGSGASNAVNIASNPINKQIGSSVASEAAKDATEGSFLDKLTSNSKDFLTKPKNLLTLATLAGSIASKPKEKSPEKRAAEEKRYMKAMMLSPSERAAYEANNLAERQMERRIERNKYLPEERFATKSLYRKSHTPDEYNKTGKWLSYYDNPHFTGNPIHMKKGGILPQMMQEEEMETPNTKGIFFKGYTKGQDDKVPAALSDGEYVIPADVVAHAGDGNSMAGGKQFDKFIKNIRKSKGGKITLPPKTKSLINYMR